VLISENILSVSFQFDTLCEVAMNRISEALQRLYEQIPRPSERELPRILIYFDEAHLLFKKICLQDSTGEDSTYYHALCSALTLMCREEILCLFLSTNSSIARYAPTSYKLSSARKLNDLKHLQPPYTSFWLDQHKPFPIYPGTVTLWEASQVAFICRFGRPL
jgi:hypothetical protein